MKLLVRDCTKSGGATPPLAVCKAESFVQQASLLVHSCSLRHRQIQISRAAGFTGDKMLL